MISEKVQKLELENKRLGELIVKINENIPKPKDCKNCRHYVQHYFKDEYGNFCMLYMGHCTCGVPIGKRKGKKHPSLEDTCLCFEEKGLRLERKIKHG